MGRHPKAAEVRIKHQRLGIEALPLETRRAILILKGPLGMGWMEIEELSAQPYDEKWEEKTLGRYGFVDWDNLPPKVLAQFSTRKLAHSNLHRWYYLTVVQKSGESADNSKLAQDTIRKYMKRGGIEGLDEAAINAAADQIFLMLESIKPEDRANSKKYLLALAEITQKGRRAAVQERLASDAEKRTTELEKMNDLQLRRAERETAKLSDKLGKGKAITESDINSIRERVFGLPPVAHA